MSAPDIVREQALAELRAEIRESGATGWRGCDARHLKILAAVIDDRAVLLAACEAIAAYDPDADNRLRTIARAAITKARGGGK